MIKLKGYNKSIINKSKRRMRKMPKNKDKQNEKRGKDRVILIELNLKIIKY